MSEQAPTWLSLVPPLLAIGIALAFKRVVTALGIGVAVGALLVSGFAPLAAVTRFGGYLWNALLDGSHQWILVFALTLGGLMRMISDFAGAASAGPGMLRFATDRRRGQVTAWVLGIVFFFDDYANTLFVGSSMSAVSDRLRMSREKLAFIVDATAAPVASLAPFSTWIAMELGYIADQCGRLGIDADAYSLFLRTIPSRFYPALMLGFGFVIALTGRDLGPMAAAERRALEAPVSTQQESSAAVVPGSGWLLGLPIALVVGAVVLGLYVTGRAATLEAGEPLTVRNVLSNASSSKAMVVAALVGGIATLALVVRQRRATLGGALLTWLRGAGYIVPVMAILLFAWALGDVCADLGTARFLVATLGSGFDPGWLPTVVFLVSAVVSFATGTSWGTMGILFPLAVPLAHELANPDPELALMVATISSILAGSVFGDHCSPISDTTIMSALASGCDQIAHVRTQLPYALLVAVVSVVCGSIPDGFGFWPPWVGLLLGLAVLYLALRVGSGLDARRAAREARSTAA